MLNVDVCQVNDLHAPLLPVHALTGNGIRFLGSEKRWIPDAFLKKQRSAEPLARFSSEMGAGSAEVWLELSAQVWC